MITKSNLRIHVDFQAILLSFPDFVGHIPRCACETQHFTASPNEAQIPSQTKIENFYDAINVEANIVWFEIPKDNVLKEGDIVSNYTW